MCGGEMSNWGSLDEGFESHESLAKDWGIALIRPEITVEAIETIEGLRFISIVFKSPSGDVEVMLEIGMAFAFAKDLHEIAEWAAHAPKQVRALTVVPPAKATEVHNPAPIYPVKGMEQPHAGA